MDNVQHHECLLQQAIAVFEADENISMSEAAKMFNLPRSTVAHRYAGRVTRGTSHASQQLLSQAEENVVENHAIQMAQWGFPLKISMLRDLAYGIQKHRVYGALHDAVSQIPQPQYPGKRWHLRFLERHSNLKALYSRTLDQARAFTNNPKLIEEFFALYQSVVKEYNIQPWNTYNMDEKGVQLGVAASARVIVPARCKSQFANQDGNCENVTILECICADGTVLPPFLIFKGKHHQYGWHNNDTTPSNWFFGISPKGWSDEELGFEWLRQLFSPSTTVSNPNEYRLLLLDGHSSHISPQFIYHAIDHKIVVLCLPPHSTHWLQPLDVGIFSPLQHYYGQLVDDSGRMGLGAINKSKFVALYQTARDKTFTPELIGSAFSATGYIPFDPSRVLNKLPVSEHSEITDSTLTIQVQRPSTPDSLPAIQNHLSEILQDPSLQDITTPTKNRILQLVRSAENAFAQQALQLEINSKLRAAAAMSTKHKKDGSKRVLSVARVLTAKEAQILKAKRDLDEEKKIAAAEKRKAAAEKKKATLASASNTSGVVKKRQPPKKRSPLISVMPGPSSE